MESPNCCTAEDGISGNSVSSEQWCICFNCMHKAEKTVNAPVGRIPEAMEIGERPFGRLTEELTRKRNKVAQGICRQRCRSYKKDLDFAKNKIKANTVDNILNHYSLLKEAETIENEKLDKNTQEVSNRNSLKRPDIPTVSLRKSEEFAKDTTKKSPRNRTKNTLRLKRSATFVLEDLPSQSNINKCNSSKEQKAFKVTRSRINLLEEKSEESDKKTQGVKPTSSSSPRRHVMPRLHGSAPNPNPSGKESEESNEQYQPQTERSSTRMQNSKTNKQADCEDKSVNKSVSEVEAEYFLKRINRLFTASETDKEVEKQMGHRPQTCLLPPQSLASSRTRSFLQNTVSKYKWVFIPGVTYYDLDKQLLSKQREREKVKVRQFELDTIQADLRRKETNIRRLVRRSTSIREEMSHVTTGRPPR
ncbi:uncharacterized protein LOC133201232 [Saccostrea echinata]|uniref:uncharacterized protein LOC133201232 n=1 Tax=Saccostrea echinata TaxID=191078 RepID=UPI002A809A6A|nr:uncharacterized protein LOC133201232 [Saccostrea echinata]